MTQPETVIQLLDRLIEETVEWHHEAELSGEATEFACTNKMLRDYKDIRTALLDAVKKLESNKHRVCYDGFTRDMVEWVRIASEFGVNEVGK